MCTNVSGVPVASINRINRTSAGANQELWPCIRNGELPPSFLPFLHTKRTVRIWYGNRNSDVRNGGCAYVNGFNVLVPLCADDADIRGCADKSLARPGRKQDTATKLGIYSTYSPRSSILFLARCCNFCKPLRKKRRLSVQPGLRDSNDLRVGRKMATFQLFFQSREQAVARRGQIRRIGWVIKTLEAQVGQFLLGFKCPLSRGIVVQEQDLPVTFFLQNVLQLHQQR